MTTSLRVHAPASPSRWPTPYRPPWPRRSLPPLPRRFLRNAQTLAAYWSGGPRIARWLRHAFHLRLIPGIRVHHRCRRRRVAGSADLACATLLSLPTAVSGADPYERLNALRRDLWILMLPNPDDSPTGRFELAVGVGIPLLVTGELRLPVPVVDLWPAAVLGTAVPEAAVDKYRHARPWEDDIGAPAQPGQWAAVDEIAQTEPMEDPTQGQLRGGVPTQLLLASPPCYLRRCERGGRSGARRGHGCGGGSALEPARGRRGAGPSPVPGCAACRPRICM
jgi:hypothetical protein